MRGKVEDAKKLWNYRGITPAYAGKSPSGMTTPTVYQDHPRLCGEKDTAESKESREKGSPPPMRGKVMGCYLVGAVYRITPAYAGKSMGDRNARER